MGVGCTTGSIRCSNLALLSLALLASHAAAFGAGGSTRVPTLRSGRSTFMNGAVGADPHSGLGGNSSVLVSVVIMNWKRPENVQRIIKKYLEYGNIGEVIVWMCKEDTKFTFDHRKVRIIDDVAANDQYGVSIRFKGCMEAKYPWVLIQDDDHYAKERGLAKFIAAKTVYPTRLVGTFARDWNPPSQPAYSKEPKRSGPRPIVLTSLMLTDKSTCRAFWEHVHLVEEYVHNFSVPLWNGEDIFFSLVSFKTTGQIPLAVGAGKVFMPQENTGIHFVGNHDNYRDEFLKYAIKQLGIDDSDYQHKTKA
eukprot:gene21138-28026_t